MDDFQVSKVKRPGKTPDPGEQQRVETAFEDVVLNYAKYHNLEDPTNPTFTPEGMCAFLAATLSEGCSIDVASFQRAFQDTAWEADVLLFLATISLDGEDLLKPTEVAQFAKQMGIKWEGPKDNFEGFLKMLAKKEAQAPLHDVNGDYFPDHDPVDLDDHETPYI